MTGPQHRVAAISIVIPCHNCRPFIGRAIESALGQTLPPDKVIVVDDGSTDRGGDVARASGVQTIRQDKAGVSAARNAGLEAATGTHVLFLDADDVLEPNALRSLAEANAGSTTSVVMAGSCAFDDSSGEVTWRKQAPRTFFPSILQENPGIIGSWMAPAALVRALGGFRTDMAIFEDWEMLARLAFHGADLRTTEAVAVRYRQHHASTMATAESRRRAEGHVQVLTTISHLVRKRTDVLERHGEVAFWSAWTAYQRGHAAIHQGAALDDLGRQIEYLAANGPDSLTHLRTARAVRVLGGRRTLRIIRVLSAIARGFQRRSQ